jgi:hypothetical protein
MNKISFAIITCATSVAFAQGAGSGAAKAPEMKKAPAADAKAPAADAKAPAAKKPEMPKAPAEVAELAKMLVGTWNCTGNAAMDMADMTKMSPMKMKMVMKLDADKAWITASMAGGMIKMNMMTTYDAQSKKWYRILTDSTGGSEIAWSAGAQSNKVVWDGEARGMGMKPWKTRTTEDIVSPKETKMTGEMSMDGKTWMKMWDASCKK